MSGIPAGAVEALMGVAVAGAVLHVELQRRAGAGPIVGPRAMSWYLRDCRKLLRECVPEAVGLLACLAIAAVLRARGDVRNPEHADAEAWDQIKSQWPLLITADTLLSLQAMFRLVVLVSALLGARSPASVCVGRGGALCLSLSRAPPRPPDRRVACLRSRRPSLRQCDMAWEHASQARGQHEIVGSGALGGDAWVLRSARGAALGADLRRWGRRGQLLLSLQAMFRRVVLVSALLGARRPASVFSKPPARQHPRIAKYWKVQRR